MIKCASLLTIWLLIFGNSAAEDIIIKMPYTNGSCFESPNVADMIGRNISDYFCVVACEIPDSTNAAKINRDVQKAVELAYPDRPELKGQPLYLQYIYTIERHENLVFFGIPSPVDVHTGLHVVLNQSQNKYYVLPCASVADLDTLLSTETFNLYADGWVLQYCVFLSSLMNPWCPVRMIGSGKELRLLATLRNAGYELADAQALDTILVEMPTIKRNGNKMEITYYIAAGTFIQKVSVALEGSRVLNYSEKRITRVPNLFGQGVR